MKYRLSPILFIFIIFAFTQSRAQWTEPVEIDGEFRLGAPRVAAVGRNSACRWCQPALDMVSALGRQRRHLDRAGHTGRHLQIHRDARSEIFKRPAASGLEGGHRPRQNAAFSCLKS